MRGREGEGERGGFEKVCKVCFNFVFYFCSCFCYSVCFVLHFIVVLCKLRDEGKRGGRGEGERASTACFPHSLTTMAKSTKKGLCSFKNYAHFPSF